MTKRRERRETKKKKRRKEEEGRARLLLSATKVGLTQSHCPRIILPV